MATLDDLNIPDIGKMTDDQLLELLKSRRSDRRKPSDKPKKAAKSKPTPTPTVESLSAEQLENLIKLLEES
jgi:hypothetical protein